VTLFLHERTIFAISIAEIGGCTVDSIELAANTRRELDDFCANVRRGEDPYAYDLSGFGMVGLRDLLPATTCERLLQHDRIVIAPHEKLHLVPWSTLAVDDTRLFEHAGVTIAPNLSCLDVLAGPWPGSPHTWITGAPDYRANASSLSPVDPAQEEHDAVTAAWSGSLAGSTHGLRSTEESLLAVLRGEGSIDLLHAICHGVIDHAEPSASALILADGKVDAAEIAFAGACPDEVVLAACSTGWRPAAVGEIILSGDDVVGLPGAFLEAGARSIVMSVPRAHDETSAQFMSHYHQARADGQAPIDAYRSTQIAMGNVADPALWCGYALYGSPSRGIELREQKDQP